MDSSAFLYVNELSRSVSSLQKVFDCPICLDMLNDPVRTTVCGHTFCKKCINRVLKSDCQKKPCPLCNTPLTHRSISDNTNTLKFLQLTLELLTAINLDTGINITEYRTNNQSTNEASEDSEELFKVKKTYSNKSSFIKDKRKLVSDHRDENNINKKERNSDTILKTKNSRVHKLVDLKDYFLGNNKNDVKEKKKIDNDVDRKVLSKEPHKKEKKKFNDEDITIEDGNSSKNLSVNVMKNQNSSVINNVEDNAGSFCSIDVLDSDGIGTKNNCFEKNLVSEQNNKGINNIGVIVGSNATSGSSTSNPAMDVDELCDISIVARRNNTYENGIVPKSSCSSEQKSLDEYNKGTIFSDNLVLGCNNLSLAQLSNVSNNLDKSVPDETFTGNDDNLNQISIPELADSNTVKNTEADDSVKLLNRSAVDGDFCKKSVNVSDKKTDKNYDENVNYNFNVPFKLGDLSLLKDIGKLELKRNQDSVSLPFVLFGTLEINLKKRKLDELIDGDDDGENYSIKVDDIKRIKLFDSPSNLINEMDNVQHKSSSVENPIAEKVRKSFYPSASNQSGRSFESGSDLVNENRNDSIPSQSARTDFDIFDEEKNSDEDDNDGINTWDDESFSQYGLKSISQMVPQKQIDLKSGHHALDGIEQHSVLDIDDCCTVINEEIAVHKDKIKVCQREALLSQKQMDVKNRHHGFDILTNHDDTNDECCTVINEEIVFNKNKIKVCQREAINFKVPFSKTLSQPLSKNYENKSVSPKNLQNVSVNEIENSEPDCNKKLLSDLTSNANLNKNQMKSDKHLCNSNSDVDVSINEIESSEPVEDGVKNTNRFLNKAKRNSESDLKLVEKEVQQNDKIILSSKSSSSSVLSQKNNGIEKECDEIRKRIALFEEELLRNNSEKDLQNKLVTNKQISSSTDEELMKNTCDVTPEADITIISTSEDEDDDNNINDSILPTPPTDNVNSSGIDFGCLSSKKDKVKRDGCGNITVMDSETNEIPSSLSDMNCLKSFNSSILNNARDIIPSVDTETTSGSQSIKAIPDSSFGDKLNLPNSSQMEVNENANINETSLVTGSNRLNKDITLNKSMKSMSFVHSRLTIAQYQELKMFAFHFNSDITNNIIDGMTTHVIISHEKNNRAPHTYKYLKGVASRLWVVSSNWISDSLKAGKVLPEDNYLVLDPSGEPGPFRCRQPDVSPPLINFIFLLSPPFTNSTTEQVESLILLCGGEISSLQVLADLNYKPNIPRILLMDESSDPSISECWMNKYHLIIVNIEWLLEVVGQYKLVPLNPFMMAPYSLQLLRNLSIPEEIISDDVTEEEDDCEDVSMGE